MDFDLTAQQQARRDRLLTQIREQLAHEPPTAPRHLTRQQWRTAAGIGLTGLCLPADLHGGGLGALDTALGLEAFGEACSDTGLVFAVSAHLLACGVPIRDHARGPERERLLSGMASGDLIAANAITEDEAGSDVARLRVCAERDGDSYVLEGEKSFASNAPVADVVVTYAVTSPAGGFLGLTAFAVPTDLPGVTVGAPLEKMGLHGCPAARISFRGCRVPSDHRLGAEGEGGAIFQASMRWERACLPAGYLGLMERQLRQCVQQARGRRQFGRSIGEFQAVSHRIATMKQRLESARWLLYRACWQLDQGHEDTAAIGLAKVAASEAAVANAIDAMQIFGGTGYLTGAGIEQQLRDSLPGTIYSGTSEIQRELIAKEVGL